MIEILRRELTFDSCSKGERIFTRVDEPVDRTQVRAVLQIAHGMAEHSLCYQAFSEYMACHGYAVAAGSLAGTAIPWFVSCNDGTCEGLLYPDLRACGVQFCPEVCSGPRGSGFLLDRFVDGMGGAW